MIGDRVNDRHSQTIVVPIEPTPDMIHAAFDLRWEQPNVPGSGTGDLVNIWKVMLAAAPQSARPDSPYRELWERFVSLQTGDVQLLAKDAMRYHKIKTLLMGYKLARYLESLPREPVTEESFDAAMDAAPDATDSGSSG